MGVPWLATAEICQVELILRFILAGPPTVIACEFSDRQHVLVDPALSYEWCLLNNIDKGDVSSAFTACTSCTRMCRNGLRKLSNGRFHLSIHVMRNGSGAGDLMQRWGINGVASISVSLAPSKRACHRFDWARIFRYHRQIIQFYLDNWLVSALNGCSMPSKNVWMLKRRG